MLFSYSNLFYYHIVMVKVSTHSNIVCLTVYITYVYICYIST